MPVYGAQTKQVGEPKKFFSGRVWHFAVVTWPDDRRVCGGQSIGDRTHEGTEDHQSAKRMSQPEAKHSDHGTKKQEPIPARFRPEDRLGAQHQHSIWNFHRMEMESDVADGPVVTMFVHQEFGVVGQIDDARAEFGGGQADEPRLVDMVEDTAKSLAGYLGQGSDLDQPRS